MSSSTIPTLLRGRRVLVVDDDADGRELVGELLQEAGAEVRTAGDADAAMSDLAAFTPHLVVCDVNMPGIDGYTLMRRIRALPPAEGGNVKAAAFTGFGRPEDHTRSAQAGFDLHLTKPIDGADLARALAALLGDPDAAPSANGR